MQTPWQRRLMWLCVIMSVWLLPVAAAQPEAEVESDNGAQAGAPILLSTGISSGFPGFNRFSVAAAMQYQSFGAQLRLAPTEAGLYFGVSLRGYLPIGGFVPLYLGAGAGVYGDSTELHLTLGGHVPLAERVRLDLEGGAARVNNLLGSQWLPWVSIGLSYTFPVSADALSGGGPRIIAGRGSNRGVQCLPHGEESLMKALDDTVDSFITNAAATYGGSYRNLEYDLSIEETTMTDRYARIVVRYSGSVEHAVGGGRESASGTATVEFAWDGCRWRRTSLRY